MVDEGGVVDILGEETWRRGLTEVKKVTGEMRYMTMQSEREQE